MLTWMRRRRLRRETNLEAWRRLRQGQNDVVAELLGRTHT